MFEKFEQLMLNSKTFWASVELDLNKSYVKEGYGESVEQTCFRTKISYGEF